jgi:cytidyltransferase-like protein
MRVIGARSLGEQVNRKILVMGLPAAGKTTPANILASLLNAPAFNAVPGSLSSDCGFSWLDRTGAGRFEDTNQVFVPPKWFDPCVAAPGRLQYWAERALALLRPPFDPQKFTAIFIGRYQPFHGGHQRLIEKGLCRVGQVRIAVRDTPGIDAKSPLPFFAVKQRIEAALPAHAGRFVVVSLSNITNILYGREVGYSVERNVLDEVSKAISATEIRKLSAVP